jgi:flagellin-like protein
MAQQDRAVTPVISTILMVAIVIILATVISTFALGLAENLTDPAPTVGQTSGEFEPGSDSDQQIVRITHVAGDSVNIENIEIIVRASGPGDDLPTEARLVDLPAEGQFMTDNINGNGDLISSRTSTADIIEEDSSNTWGAGKTIEFRIGVGGADFRDPVPNYNEDHEANELEVIIVHTPSNSILSEHTFTP